MSHDVDRSNARNLVNGCFTKLIIGTTVLGVGAVGWELLTDRSAPVAKTLHGETAIAAVRAGYNMAPDLEKMGIAGFIILVAIAAIYIIWTRERPKTRIVAKVNLAKGGVDIVASAVIVEGKTQNKENIVSVLTIADGAPEGALVLERQEEHPLHRGVFVPDFVAAETRDIIAKIPANQRPS